MKTIITKKDYGKKETFKKWNGKFLGDDSCLLYTSPSPRD